MWCAKLCPCASDTVWCPHAAGIYSVQIFVSERCKIIARCSDIIPNLANIMQFTDVSFVLMRTPCDGRVLKHELLLRKTMQCTSVSCKAHQTVANTGHSCANTTQPRNSNTKRPKYCMLICLAFWFWPFHWTEGTIFTLYIFGFCA